MLRQRRRDRPLVQVLVNRGCPHCLEALDRICEMAEGAGVAVAATDVAAHPEVARDRGVQCSPALVVDDEVVGLGVPGPGTFAELATRAG